MSPTLPPSKPKVLLFDIGGVCVISPMRAIRDHELSTHLPVGYINFAISFSGPSGAWQRLERGTARMDAAWFAAFKTDLERREAWEAFHQRIGGSESSSRKEKVPEIDAEGLYWTMMGASREVDPWMGPALKRLREKGYRLAALSNTSIFPEGHEYNEIPEGDVRRVFEVFVSSAHVGMRKPERAIYEFTMARLRERWPDVGLEARDVLFLDDIGENLKMGRAVGWRTLKVGLGGTREAVRELERITGESLLEEEGQRQESRSAKAKL